MTPISTSGMCGQVHTPPIGVEIHPQYPMPLHLQHFGSTAAFIILPIRRDHPRYSRPGGKANRESCIDHATAGQIERHVETNVTKRSQERKGRARDKTRGRPSLGWVSFCCPSGQRLYRAFQERRILSGNGKTFRHNLLGRDGRRDESGATPGWFSWSEHILMSGLCSCHMGQPGFLASVEMWDGLSVSGTLAGNEEYGPRL